MPATRFIHPDNSLLIALRKLWPTRLIFCSGDRDSSVDTNDCNDLYNNPGSASEYRSEMIGGGRVEGRLKDVSCNGK